MRTIIALALALVVLAFLAAGALPAGAADLLSPLRPEGFAGEGHAANHEHYQGLRNPAGTSCCNGIDCRPTIARNINGFWEVKVNGVWRSDFSGGRVLSDAWLRLEQARLHQSVVGRWNTEAHVCASVDISGRVPTIYCVILSDEWN